MNSFTFRRTMFYNKLMRGEAFAIIERNTTGSPISLHIKLNMEVRVMEGVRYFYDYDSQSLYEEMDVIYLDNIGPDGRNKSVIGMHAATFGKIKAANDLSNNLYSNKMFLGAVVSYPESVSFTGPNSPLKTFADQMSTDYGGIDKAGKVIALDRGAQMKQFENVMSMADAEYIADMNFTVEDICRIYGVPPFKVFHFNKMTYDNMEQMGVEFVQSAILPNVTPLEQELDYKLFSPFYKSRGASIKFDLQSLMRGDIKAQSEWIKTMVSIGKLTINEARELDDQNPVEGGDVPLIQANNYFPLNKLDELADAMIESKHTKNILNTTKKDAKQGVLFDEDGEPVTDNDFEKLQMSQNKTPSK